MNSFVLSSGTERPDESLENCSLHATALVDSVLCSVESFATARPADDDITSILALLV